MLLTLPAYDNVPTTRLFVEILADGGLHSREITLLLPGGPGGNHSVYNEIKDKIYHYNNIILLDPRGCGLSDPANCEFCTIDHYVKDIELLLAALNIERVTLLGGSYGAMAALKFSTEYPSKVNRLISLAGAPSGKFISLAKQNLAQLGTTEQIAFGEKLWSGSFTSTEEFEEYYRVLAPLYIYHAHNYQETAQPPTTQAKIPYNIDVLNLGFKQFLPTFDITKKLSNISAEVHLICGKNDWINDSSLIQEAHELITNSRLYLFDQCGHFIWKDKKDEFFQLLDEIYQQSLLSYRTNFP